MTDVIKKINSGRDINNNSTIVFVTPVGSSTYKKVEGFLDHAVYVSGVNSATDNGYLDRRFDDPTYYSA